MTQLPDGWQLKKIADIAEVNPRRPKIERDEDAATTFVPMAAVDQVLGGITDAQQRPFSAVRKGYTYFEEGDVIFAKITPCMENGKHAVARDLIDGIGFGTTEFHVIRPRAEVSAEWIWLQLRRPSVLAELTGQFSGSVGLQRLPPQVLEALAIPVPPVQAMDALTNKIRRGLNLIIDGSAIADRSLSCLPDLERAVIDEEIAAATSAAPTRRFSDIAEIRSGLTKGRKTNEPVTSHPYLRAANLGDGFLDLGEIKTIEVTTSEASKFALRRGDVLMIEGGSAHRLGNGWVWEGQIDACLHQNHVFRARPDTAVIDPHYLAWLLRSAGPRNYFLNAAKQTTGIASINHTQVSALELPVPDKAAQRAVVARIDARVSAVRQLRARYTAALARLSELREATYSAAFNGGN